MPSDSDWVDVESSDWEDVAPASKAKPKTWADKAGLKSPYARAGADLAEGAASGLASTVYHGGDLIRRATGMERVIDTPEVKAAMTAPDSFAGKTGKFVEQAAEYAIPGGVATTLTKAASLPVRAAAQGVAAGLTSGVQSGGSPQQMAMSAALGAVGPIVGAGVRKLAGSAAEKALGVTKADRGYGKTPGVAILEETSGIRPATVEASARAKSSALTKEMEGLVDAASGPNGARGSLATARQSVSDRITDATTQRAIDTAAKLKPLSDRLTTDAVTGRPLAASQTPRGILNMKRGLRKDFVTNWNPDSNPAAVRDAAKIASRALDAELDQASPQIAGLNQRISSLIPVAERAGSSARAAQLAEQIIDQATRPTGGMVLPGLVGMSGGGLPGLAATTIAQSAARTPAVRMAAARTAYGAAKRIPSWTGAATIPQALRSVESDQLASPGTIETAPIAAYETPLTPEERIQFAAWKQKNAPSDSGEDYDLQGAFKADIAGTLPRDSRGHTTDQFKKPNHPTFSVESQYSGKNGEIGGRWEDKNGKVTFYASPTNLKYQSAADLKRYFAENEPDVTLVLPSVATR